MENNNETWRGIKENSEAEITEKHSRFIASVRTIASKDDVSASLKEIMALYPRATHYCYAYRLGTGAQDEYGSDAGEPSGTAGRPILGVLKRHNLTNTLLVVTRYFGGVKLGVPGLISAYGEAAEVGIAASNIVTLTTGHLLLIVCQYDMSKTVRTNFLKCGVTETLIKTEWGENVTFHVTVLSNVTKKVTDTFAELVARHALLAFEWKEQIQCIVENE